MHYTSQHGNGTMTSFVLVKNVSYLCTLEIMPSRVRLNVQPSGIRRRQPNKCILPKAAFNDCKNTVRSLKDEACRSVMPHNQVTTGSTPWLKASLYVGRVVDAGIKAPQHRRILPRRQSLGTNYCPSLRRWQWRQNDVTAAWRRKCGIVIVIKVSMLAMSTNWRRVFIGSTSQAGWDPHHSVTTYYIPYYWKNNNTNKMSRFIGYQENCCKCQECCIVCWR